MAYSRIKFTPDALEREALGLIDEKVSHARQRVDALNDGELLAKNRAVWREEFLEKNTFLMEKSGNGLQDSEILAFLREFVDEKPYPREETSTIRYYERLIRSYDLDKKRIRAVIAGLYRDPDGSVSLTKAQMRNIFGL